MADPTRPNLATVEGATTAPVDRYAAVTGAFVEYHEDLYRYLIRATRDGDAAQDLLQDTYLRLVRELEAGRPPTQLRPWLYRVATNLVISRGRRRTTALAWLRRHGGDAERASVGSPESAVVDHERTATLEATLAALPTETRTALLLAAEGFRGEEIAAAIGRSHTATRVLLSRARVRVREEFERREAGRWP